MRLRLPTFLVLSSAATLSLASRGKGQHKAASCTLVASGGDDAPQFLSAVKSCTTVVIPKTTTLNINSRLNMTGLSNTHIDLAGTIKFSPDIPYWTGNGFFIPFQSQITFWLVGGKNIHLSGGGTLDGSGQVWYDAFASNSTLLRPIILTITQASDVVVENITMINSPEWHNLINESKNVVYRNIHINAASTSSHTAKNTDGWNIYRSDNVVITDSVINNGDDCVAFKPNATNILVANLNCTGSHGISVGSLGQYPGMFDIVENVIARNIRMSNAQNGARIKAWAGPNVGSGIVKNITFDGFIESKVDHPVIIDQCYMTNATACAQFPSNTFIQDIWFNNISGTGTSSTVAQLTCSPDGRCKNINVNNLHLAAPAGTAKYTCQNVVLSGNSASLFPNCTVT
ncbi:putative glycoside hydrolase family 28 protein [Lyophyllum shimeji]|uniref:galacturonan 1,4-alpha-galacturonidase n=1 Tax=Lyophyllum shimeji TaxID=47721 RepID=A0A9P3UNI5_LYOSH|nr:putative glycoside hydrolase family 28 protein [Lyophyllum shimeji]